MKLLGLNSPEIFIILVVFLSILGTKRIEKGFLLFKKLLKFLLSKEENQTLVYSKVKSDEPLVSEDKEEIKAEREEQRKKEKMAERRNEGDNERKKRKQKRGQIHKGMFKKARVRIIHTSRKQEIK